MEILLVDFKHGARENEFDVNVARVNRFKYMLDRSRNQPFQCFLIDITEHRIRFPGACLSVRKDRSVIPVHDIANRFMANRFVDAMLARIRVEHVVHREHRLLR